MEHVPAAQSLALALGVGSAISLICTRLRVPPILFLLLAGVALGRGGARLVGTYNLGDALTAFITIAVAVLVFEGGLHLSITGLRARGRAVAGLLSLGPIVTFTLASLAARLVLRFEWDIAALLGAVLIVTGPTVVQPLLRRWRLSPNLHTTLWAEAVLLDPVGVLAVVAVLDFVLADARSNAGASVSQALVAGAVPLATGLLAGAAVGAAARAALRFFSGQSSPDPRQMSLFAMAACMTAVGVGEWTAPQGGLVAVTLCAVILAGSRALGAEDMKRFKEQVAAVLVGGLFVLLGSAVRPSSFQALETRDFVFVAVMMLAVRPLAVLTSTIGSELTGRERAFACFLAPRGLVATSTCSLAVAQIADAAAGLTDQSSPDAAPQSIAHAARLLADARHAHTVLLLLVVATVSAGTLLGPLLATLLRVRTNYEQEPLAPHAAAAPPPA